MPTRTITEPTAVQQLLDTYNRKMKAANVKTLETSGKYAICLISLAGGVSQPGDYAALKSAVEGITGITEIELLIDGQCPASIPEGKQLRMICEAHLRIDDVPVEEI